MALTASGNAQDIKGELIMRYSELEIRFYKANDKDYKGLSWAVNYIWKGIQAGILNTFNPIGKNH